MFKKYFTPKEANQRLPLIKKIVCDILEKGKVLRSMAQEYEGGKIPDEIFNLKTEVEELMGELDDLGCFYKDWNFEIGLVDFPAFIDGQEVFLCWRSDEPHLQWYHSIEEGYPGRKPIPQNYLNN